jgi:hypothetical protein
MVTAIVAVEAVAPGRGRVARFCAVNVGLTGTLRPCQGALS